MVGGSVRRKKPRNNNNVTGTVMGVSFNTHVFILWLPKSIFVKFAKYCPPSSAATGISIKHSSRQSLLLQPSNILAASKLYCQHCSHGFAAAFSLIPHIAPYSPYLTRPLNALLFTQHLTSRCPSKLHTSCPWPPNAVPTRASKAFSTSMGEPFSP